MQAQTAKVFVTFSLIQPVKDSIKRSSNSAQSIQAVTNIANVSANVAATTLDQLRNKAVETLLVSLPNTLNACIQSGWGLSVNSELIGGCAAFVQQLVRNLLPPCCVTTIDDVPLFQCIRAAADSLLCDSVVTWQPSLDHDLLAKPSRRVKT
jgi:hypothetical protein